MKPSAHITDDLISLFRREDLHVWHDSIRGYDLSDFHEQPVSVAGGESPDLELQRFGIVTWEADPFSMRFTKVSPNAMELLGYRVDEWMKRESFWAERVDPRDRSRVMATRERALLMGSRARVLYRLIAKDGTLVEVQETCQMTVDSDGKLALSGCLVPGDFDLGDESPKNELSAVRSMIGEIPGLMWLCDKQLNINWSLGSDFSVLKIRSEHPRNANLFNLFPDEDKQRIHVAMHLRAVNGEFLSYEVVAVERTYQVVLKPCFNNDLKPEGCLGLAVDITERKWTEEQALRMALTDPLTGLGNYRTFRKVLDHEMRRSDRTKRPLTLLLFDLDGLKTINDRHGHIVGSRALCRFAKVLQSNCRAIDVGSRFGGDEFALVLPETDRNEATQVAARIQRSLQFDTESPSISASCGLAAYPSDGRTIEELIATADRILYTAKNLRYEGSNTRKTCLAALQQPNSGLLDNLKSASLPSETTPLHVAQFRLPDVCLTGPADKMDIDD
jgi:diguanylate cyclase (GGDEF)-like protein